jgi:hypothetical protein
MAKLISFIVPSRNLEHLNAQLDRFQENTSDLSSIEFLVKFDTDHHGAEEFIKEQVKKRPFSIKYVITPRIEGTFSLWIAVEQLFGMVDKDSYFVQILSDEPYFTTPNWDNVLRQYIGFYPDHVFRLRLSDVKYNNYATHYECAFRCDSFPIYTYRWLQLTEGTGDCWGSDAYHQCIAYHLSLGPGGYFNYYRNKSLSRDIAVNDLKMGGLDFGVGVSEQMQRERHIRNLKEWRRLSSFKMQERFSYLARRMYCYIWALEHKIESFQLVANHSQKTVMVVNGNGDVVFTVSYHLQVLVIAFNNFIRDLRTRYWIASSYRVQQFKLRIRSNPRLSKLIDDIEELPRRILCFMSLKNPKSSRRGLSGLLFGFIRYVTVFFINIFKISAQLFRFLVIRQIVPVKMRVQGSRIIRRLVTSLKNRVSHLLCEIKKVLSPFKKMIAGKNVNSHSQYSSNEYIDLNSPGIDVIYSKKYRLPPGVPVPDVIERRLSADIIQGIHDQRLSLRKKMFKKIGDKYE